MKSKTRAAPQFKQAEKETGELSSNDSSKGQKDLTQQASREKRHTTRSPPKLDQAAAYYDKVYFDSSGSEEEEGDTVRPLQLCKVFPLFRAYLQPPEGPCVYIQLHSVEHTSIGRNYLEQKEVS